MSDAATVKLLEAHKAKEALAAHFYMDAVSWCNFNGYLGTADYFHAAAEGQWKDYWLYDHVVRDIFRVEPETPAVPKIQRTYKTLLQLMQTVLEMEQSITASLEELHAAASPRIQAEILPKLHVQNEGERQLTDFIRLLVNAGDNAAAIEQADKYISGTVAR